MQVAPSAAYATYADHEAAVAAGDAQECARLEGLLQGRARGNGHASLDRALFHAARGARALRLEDDAQTARTELEEARRGLEALELVRRTPTHERLDDLWRDVVTAAGDWAAARPLWEARRRELQDVRDLGPDRWAAQLMVARADRALGEPAAALEQAQVAAQGLITHCSGELEAVDAALALVEDLHRATGDEAGALEVAARRAARAAELDELRRAMRSEELVRILVELDALVGLQDIKASVRTLANFLRVQLLREAAGRPRAQLVQHLVFSGPPGTGKTTVARLMGRIFQAVGLLESGHVVEVGRSDLVAGFAGQTAIKTADAVASALDGILFVDEAYSLFEGPNGSSYGPEAVATLLRAMEDHRDRLVVIIAGYPEPLAELLRSNPGLSSRFTTRIDFAPYSAEELAEIFGRMAAADQYRLDPDAGPAVLRLCGAMLERADAHFGNARAVRNVYKDTLTQQADRVVACDALEEPELSTIRAEDLVWEDRPAGALPGEFERRRTQDARPSADAPG
jgi:hypothetical protein